MKSYYSCFLSHWLSKVILKWEFKAVYCLVNVFPDLYLYKSWGSIPTWLQDIIFMSSCVKTSIDIHLNTIIGIDTVYFKYRWCCRSVQTSLKEATASSFDGGEFTNLTERIDLFLWTSTSELIAHNTHYPRNVIDMEWSSVGGTFSQEIQGENIKR